jgi:hypothetical protein
MLRFCGFELELEVDAVLHRSAEEPAICSATDESGQRWLIVEAHHGDNEVSWFCAPASQLAVELVASGRASANDAILHSSTGWVEVVRVVRGHAVPDQRVPCSELATTSPATAAPAAI